MEPKIIIFWLLLLFGVPLCIVLTKLSRKFLNFIFIMMVVSLCEPNRLAIMLIERTDYRAITRGLEVSATDFLALILIVAMFLRPKEFKIRWFPPMIGSYVIFTVVALVSYYLCADYLTIPQKYFSQYPLTSYDYFEIGLYPVFEIAKVIRGIFLLWVTINFLSEKGGLRYLGVASICSIYYLTFYALIDRYIYGEYRIAATLQHSNVLGSYMILLSCIVCGLGLYNKKHIYKIICYLALAAGGICIILTISRGALVFWSGSISAMIILLFLRSRKLNNLPYAMIAVVLAFGVTLKAYDSISHRFSGDSLSDYSVRDEYNMDSRLMAKDHFWGVGMGNFSAYSWNKYAAMNPHRTERPGVPAHSMWYLTLAELGLPGLIALIFIWLRFLLVVFKNWAGRPSDYHYTWLIISLMGCVGLVLQESLNNSYRFISIYFMVQIFTAIPVAIYYLENDAKLAEGAVQENSSDT